MKSGSVKILDWRTVLTIAAVQALGSVSKGVGEEKGEGGSGGAYKKPRDRIAIREIRVRTFTWRFQTMGIGRQANITSVTILMAGLCQSGT